MSTTDQFVIIVGAPMQEQTLVGPFETFDDADEWSQDNLRNGEESWIASLKDPKYFAG